MWNLESIDKHAEVCMALDGQIDETCKCTAGEDISGTVMVIPKADFGFGVSIAMICEEESICGGKTSKNH
jgi:hypothetical protein